MKGWAKSGGLKLVGKHGNLLYKVEESAAGGVVRMQRPSSYRHLHPNMKTKQNQEPRRGAEAFNPKKLEWKVLEVLGPGDGMGRGGTSRAGRGIRKLPGLTHTHPLG